MKAVILAGGFGTRLSEDCFQAKLWLKLGSQFRHIMKLYSSFELVNLLYVVDIKVILLKSISLIIFYNSDVTWTRIMIFNSKEKL